MKKILSVCFHVLATVWLLVLFLYALKLTGINEFFYSEWITLRREPVILNLFRFFGGIVVALVLGLIYGAFRDKVPQWIFPAAACGTMMVLSSLWVLMAGTIPEADCLQVKAYADLFVSGDTDFFGKGQYLTANDQNLGIFTVLVWLTRLFRSNAILVFQLLMAQLVPLGVYWGYRIVGILADQRSQFYYLILMLVCFPLYIYVPYVYGDIPAVVFLMGAVLYVYECLEKMTVFRGVMAALFMGIAVVIKKNSLIILCAVVIVLLIRCLEKKEKRLINLGILVSLCAATWLCGFLVHKAYPIAEDAKPAPSLTYIYMGLSDEDGHPGWFNGAPIVLYGKNDFDVQKTNEEAKLMIQFRWKELTADPAVFRDFYMRKLTMQWEVPMFQALPMNRAYQSNANDFVKSVYSGGAATFMETFSKCCQLLVYGTILLYLVVSIAKRKIHNIEWYLFLIAAFGGFLFSILWEAKPRYVFPYFLMMIPYAAICLGKMSGFAEGCLQRIKNKQ